MTYERTLDTALLDTEALELRGAGLTYREIAARQNCDPSTALRRCTRALAAVPYEAVSEVRQMECQRLDSLTAAVWSKAMEGNLRAVDTVLRIMKRRSEMLGLDEPTRRAVEVITPDLIGAEIARLEAELGQYGE